MKKEYRLSILDRFVCLGGECPDSCCAAEWDIIVDPRTRDRWRTIRDEAGRDRLLSGLRPVVRDGTPALALMRDAEGSCRQLTSDGLCAIQLDYGHDYLPLVCREYPRMRLESATAVVQSATLSCPEVVRLALFDTAGASFARTDKPGGARRADDPLTRRLDTLVEELFEDKSTPLGIRVFYVASVIVRLSLLAMRGALDEAALQQICGQVRPELADIRAAVGTGRLRPRPVASGAFWRGTYNLGRGRGLFGDLADLEPDARHALTDTGTVNDDTYTRVHSMVSAWREAARGQLHPAYDAIMQDYLRLSFVNKGFPWRPTAGNFIATFLNCVIPFALIQLRLWIVCQQAGQLTQGDVELAIRRTERAVGHSELIYGYLNDHPAMLRLDQYLDCLIDLY